MTQKYDMHLNKLEYMLLSCRVQVLRYLSSCAVMVRCETDGSVKEILHFSSRISGKRKPLTMLR